MLDHTYRLDRLVEASRLAMHLRTTLLLLVAVLGLGAYLLLTQPAAEHDERRVLSARPAPPIETGRIQRLRIDSPDGTFVLERVNKHWQVRHPVQARADASAVMRLLDSLSELRWVQRITGEEQQRLNLDATAHGFDPPRAIITLEQPGSTVAIKIGRDAPGGENVYLRRSDLDDVFVASRAPFKELPRSALDLRDRRLVTLPPDRIKRLEWTLRSGAYQLAKTSDDQWAIEHPVRARANSPAIRQWLNRLYEFRIHDFIAESVAAGSFYGFDQPHRQLTLRSDDATESFTLIIGNPIDQAETIYYANILGRDQVFAVTAEAVKWLDPPRQDFRDYRLVPIPPLEFGGLLMTEQEQTLHITLNSQKVWEVTSPKRFVAASDRVNAILHAWSTAVALEFIDPPFRDLTPYGLDDTTRVIRLQPHLPPPDNTISPGPAATTTADRDITFILGGVATNGSFYAQVSGSASIAVLPAALLQHFSTQPVHFRDPTVLTLNPSDIQRITQISKDVTNTVELSDGLFRAAAGFVPDTGAIAVLIQQAAQLRASSLLEEDPQDVAAYGLKPPAAQIIFGLGTAGLNRVLLIGASDEQGGRYAQRQGIDFVFTLPEATVADLLKPVAHALSPPSTRAPRSSPPE